MKNYTLAALLAVSSAALLPAASFAHHGSGGQFDTANSITVTGVVTKVRYVNPHGYIYFDVTEKDGTINPWRCELRSGSIHKRSGWTEEMFAPGTQVTIEGAPAWREEFGCMTRTITFADGRTISRTEVFDDAGKSVPKPRTLRVKGKPNFEGNWVAARGQRPPRPEGGMGAPDGMGPPAGGAMGPPPGGMGAGGESEFLSMSTRYALSKAGIAASQNFKSTDNPRYNCQATNLFHDWAFDQHINAIQVYEDNIIIRYGFMDIVRTIHTDMKSHPEDITPSRAGHSIGHWEGDTLVVDTIGFAPGYLEGGPRSVAAHSDALHVKERFTMSKDGSTLSRTYEISDSKNLTESFSGEDSVTYTQDAFDPYDCEDLTEEIVDGF